MAMLKKNIINRSIHLALLSMSSTLSFYSPNISAETDELLENNEEIERIEVTGSRINRTDLESAQPIVVISNDDMKAQGFTNAFEALQGLAQNTGTVQGNEFGAQGGFTPNADVISLRGFGPGYTLILVNGRRISENPTPYNGQSNFVNLNSLPVAAIERIEIITNGASAIYGSDAVAGVVNVILKKDIETTTVTASYGTSEQGGGDTSQFSITSGITGEDYSIGGSLEYNKTKPIYSRDRDFLDSIEDNPAGTGILSRGILLYDAAVGTYRDPGEQACLDSGSGYEYTEREGFGYYCGVDVTGDRTIVNQRESVNGYLFATYDITDSLQFFSDAMFTKLESGVYGSRHFYSEYLFMNTPDGDGNYGTRDYVLYQRIFNFDEMGQRSTEFYEDTYAFSAGFNGVLNDNFNWQIYYSESRYDYQSQRDWMKEEAIAEIFLGEIDNPYGLYNGEGSVGLFDEITSDIKDQLIGTQIINADSYSRTISADITGDLLDLTHGPVAFAAVAEFNSQGYDLIQDERTLNQDGMGWAGLTGTEGGGDRDRYAVGLEFLIPVLEDLELTLAARYDRYDDDTTDVGGRTSPSIAATYHPLEQLKFRANWSQGFRAPDMHYVFAEDSGFYSSAYDLVACAADNSDTSDFIPSEATCESTSYQGTRSGSLILEEEKSTSWGLGVIFEPMDKLEVTIDYYDIELEDLIADESAQDLLQLEYQCNAGINGKDADSGECQTAYDKITRVADGEPGAGSLESISLTPENKSFYQQKGIDASAKYRIDSQNMGTWDFSLQWTHILNTRYQVSDGDDVIEYRDNKDNYEPRSKTNAFISWNYQDVTIGLLAERIGSVPVWIQPESSYDDLGNVVNVERLSSYTTFNASFNYAISDNLSLLISGSNIFNERPEIDETHNSWPYYNSFSYAGAAAGAFYTAEISYQF